MVSTADSFPVRLSQFSKTQLTSRPTSRSSLDDHDYERKEVLALTVDDMVQRYKLPVNGQSSEPILPPMFQKRLGVDNLKLSRARSTAGSRPSSSRSQSSQKSSRPQSAHHTPQRSSASDRAFRTTERYSDIVCPPSPAHYSDTETGSRDSPDLLKLEGRPATSYQPSHKRRETGSQRSFNTNSDMGETKNNIKMTKQMVAVSNMLKDRVRSKAASSLTELREAFKYFNRDGSGEIEFHEFNKVLKEQAIDLTDTEARALFRSFDTDNSGTVSFEEFQAWLYDGKDQQLDATVGGPRLARSLSFSKRLMLEAQERSKNRQSRLTVEDMTRLDEIFRDKLFNSISEGTTRVLRAFRRIHNGRGLVITFEEFQKALKEAAINLAPEEELEFWDHFQPAHGGADFNHFRQWLIPQDALERPVTPPDPSQKDQVLRAKIKATIARAPYQLMQTFRQVKPAQTGSGINKAEFAEVCKKFGMTFTPEEVDAFYDKFDDDKSGEIDYVEFCNWITESHSAPAVTLKVGNDAQDLARMKMGMSKSLRKFEMSERDILNFDKLLREKILSSLAGGGHELHRAFRKFHTGGGHAITLPEFQKAVLDFGFVLSPDEIELIFSQVASKTGGLDYQTFCKWIMDSGKGDYTSIAALQDTRARIDANGSNKLTLKSTGLRVKTLDEVKSVIRERVNNTSEGPHFLMRAFLKGHRAHGLHIPFSAFKAGLEEFSVKAPDLILLDLFAEYDKQQTGFINYKEFVMSFQEYHPDDVEKMKRTPIGLADAEQKIREIERDRPGVWLSWFEGMDIAHDGLVAPHQLRQMFDSVGINLQDWDFEQILRKVEKINGLVMYSDFLEKFTDNHKAQALRRQITRNSSPAVKTDTLMRSSSDMMKQPLLSEEKIKDVIYQRYKGMMKTFLGIDFKRTGSVSIQEFRSCLTQHGISQILSPEELSGLITKHGVEENGRVCYTNFLQHFIVTMRGRETGTLGWTQQRSLLRPKSASLSGNTSESSLKASPALSQDSQSIKKRVAVRSKSSAKAWSTAKESLGASASSGTIAHILRTTPQNEQDAEFVRKSRHLHALLKPTMLEIWKPLRREFKDKSVRAARKGEIPLAEFKHVMSMHGVKMNEEDLNLLVKTHKSPSDMTKYPAVKYDQFLKTCLGAQADWF